MSLIVVDREKCTLCGACAAVCPSGALGFGVNGPEKTGERSCIACGHCVAVCPERALNNRKSCLAEHVELADFRYPDAAEMEEILRSRRSCRVYRDRHASEGDLKRLLDLARYAPTGGNSQGLSFLVLSGRDKLDKIAGAVIAWMEQIIAAEGAGADYFAGVVKNYRQKNIDGILRGAPHLIVAIAPKTHRGPRENCSFVWAYAELFAPSLGLATCIAGFAQNCAFSGWPPLLAAIGVPPGMKVSGALMAGYPRYTYKRLPCRQPLQVEFR